MFVGRSEAKQADEMESSQRLVLLITPAIQVL